MCVVIGEFWEDYFVEDVDDQAIVTQCEWVLVDLELIICCHAVIPGRVQDVKFCDV